MTVLSPAPTDDRELAIRCGLLTPETLEVLIEVATQEAQRSTEPALWDSLTRDGLIERGLRGGLDVLGGLVNGQVRQAREINGLIAHDAMASEAASSTTTQAKTSSTGRPNCAAISFDRSNDGLRLPFSIPLIVAVVTLTRAARSP
jgi:hypothetical protein